MNAINKILCVNDTDINLFIMKRLISRSAFAKEVVCVSSGLEAVDYYLKLIGFPSDESMHPELILLDIDMPQMNGWEFLDRFTQSFLPIFPDTKVVITSYSIDDKDFEKAIQYPYVIDFLNTKMTAAYLADLRLKMADHSSSQLIQCNSSFRG